MISNYHKQTNKISSKQHLTKTNFATSIWHDIFRQTYHHFNVTKEDSWDKLSLVEPLTMSKKPRLGRGSKSYSLSLSQQVHAWLRYRNSPNARYSYISPLLCCVHFAWTLYLYCIAVEKQMCFQACTREVMKTQFLLGFDTFTDKLKSCFIFIERQIHFTLKWS